MNLFMMLIALSVSITALGEGPKSCLVELPILSCDYYDQTISIPLAIIMANSTSIKSYDGKGEKIPDFRLLMIVPPKDKTVTEGAKHRIIKTSSIKESTKTKINDKKRGPLKKVLKKPIIS